MQTTLPALDVRRLIADHFGSPVALSTLFHSVFGRDVPVARIYKWQQRNSIQGDELVLMLLHIEASTGQPLRLLDYTTTPLSVFA